MTATYRNPWYRPLGDDPEFYRTDATPVQLGKYTRYYRIQSSNPSARCYDFVVDGVCVAQRAGPASEEILDNCPYVLVDVEIGLRRYEAVRS